jgi:acyl-CoA reductase-like NAD-dependent aldehyde dehydrogenase
MHAPARIAVDTNKPSAALGRFPPDRAMIIDGREVKGGGETIERSSPAHGVVTRVPRGTAEDARAAIAAARAAFDKRPWSNETASNRARVLMKTGDLIDRNHELLTLLDSLECGNPIAQGRRIRRYTASLARELSTAEIANATDYAISTSVWSRDVDTEIGVRRGVRAGTVWIDTSWTERRSCRFETIISRESAAN